MVNLSSLLIRIQHAFQMGITGNPKLNYANVDFEFLLEVQQYGTTKSEAQKKKINRLLFLNQK